MTKVIGLNEAPAPANVGAFVIAGGALTQPATYYYRVVASGYGDFYWSTACWLSVPSAEVSITTTSANRTAIIHGDDVTGTGSVLATDYTLYRSLSTSGNYNIVDGSGVAKANVARCDGYRSNHWNSVRVDNVVTYRRYQMTTSAIAGLVPNEVLTGVTSGATAVVLTDPAGGTTFKVWTITGTFSAGETLNASVSGAGIGTFTSLSARDGFVLVDKVAAGDRFPFYADGAPVITVAGGDSTDPVVMQDVYDYLVTAGKTYCIRPISLFPAGQYINPSGNDICHIWHLNASIVSNDTTGYFKLGRGEVLSQCGLKHIFRNNVILGEVNTDGLTTGGCAIVGTWHLAYYNGFAYNAGTLESYGSMLGMNYLTKTGMATVGNCNRNPYYQATHNWEVVDSVILSSGRLNNPSQVYNSRLMLLGEVGGNTNGAGWETENAQFNCPISGPTGSGDSTYKNFIINHTTTPDFRLLNYGGVGQTITFHIVSPVFKRGTPVITALAGLAGTSYYDAIAHIKRKINVKVLDEDENPLEDVKITVLDKDDKNALFEEDSVIYSTTAVNRTGTSFTTAGGSLVVGTYYRVGDEVMLVTANPSGTTYTVTRGEFGTTAGTYNGARRKYFYKMNEYLETDSSGNADFVLSSDKFKGYDLNPAGTANKTDTLTGVSQNPFTIKLEKAGFETLIIKGNINEDLNCKYTLKSAISVFNSNTGQPVLRNNYKNSGNGRDIVTII